MPPDNTDGCCLAALVTWSVPRCSHIHNHWNTDRGPTSFPRFSAAACGRWNFTGRCAGWRGFGSCQPIPRTSRTPQTRSVGADDFPLSPEAGRRIRFRGQRMPSATPCPKQYILPSLYSAYCHNLSEKSLSRDHSRLAGQTCFSSSNFSISHAVMRLLVSKISAYLSCSANQATQTNWLARMI